MTASETKMMKTKARKKPIIRGRIMTDIATQLSEESSILGQVHRLEQKALNIAYSDLEIQVRRLCERFNIKEGLAMRLLAAKRLAFHEGIPNVILAEKQARLNNERDVEART